MTEYGRGNVLGAATALPATSAATVLLFNNIHPFVIVGFIAMSILSLIVLLGYLGRYLVNRRKD